MLNFLYCCDENYNLQFQTSLFSLLENISEKINIYLIHKAGFNKESISEKITKHIKLNEFNLIEFSSEVREFPNIIDAHVSEATYYRLFVDEHLNKTSDVLIYLDADIICVDNPFEQLLQHIDKLKESDFIISVKTEHSITDSQERLGMTSNQYFNAGVMIIDYQKWFKQEIGEQLRNKLKNNKKDLKFWDQDVLNMFFDGKYLELHKELNARVHMDAYEKLDNKERQELNNKLKKEGFINEKLLHFAGKFKPWSLKGILNKQSKPYHDYFEDIFDGEIHLQYNWKGNALKDLIYSIFSLYIFSYKKPFKLMCKVLISLFRKNEKF
tara:strand:+ start:56 stop:1033 length:978 start_codon:yes stop_codon:yes gene_type:complete